MPTRCASDPEVGASADLVGDRFAVVLCPLSVTNNWADELARFAPQLRVLCYTGAAQQRLDMRRKISEHINERRTTTVRTLRHMISQWAMALISAAIVATLKQMLGLPLAGVRYNHQKFWLEMPFQYNFIDSNLFEWWVWSMRSS